MCLVRGNVVDEMKPSDRAEAVLPIVSVAGCFAARLLLRRKEHASSPEIKVGHLRSIHLVEEMLPEVVGQIYSRSHVVAGCAEVVVG